MFKIVGPFLVYFTRDCQMASVKVGPHSFGIARGTAQFLPLPYHYDLRKDW